MIIGDKNLYMIEKKWNLEQMRKRIDNLKKVINSSIVDFYFFQSLEKTDNELDALYITFYKLKSLALKYKRELYGFVNEVQYEPKFDCNRYLNEYLYAHSNDWSSTTATHTYSYSTYYNTL